MTAIDRVARLAALAGLIAPSLAVAADGAPAWSSDGPRLAQDAVYIELPLAAGAILFGHQAHPCRQFGDRRLRF